MAALPARTRRRACEHRDQRASDHDRDRDRRRARLGLVTSAGLVRPVEAPVCRTLSCHAVAG